MTRSQLDYIAGGIYFNAPSAATEAELMLSVVEEYNPSNARKSKVRMHE